MNEKTKTIHPASGGTYQRDAKGDLAQVEASTEANPGKHELARRAAEAAAAETTTGKKRAPRGSDSAPGATEAPASTGTPPAAN
ncbi:MAG: hypothetical protein ABI843_09730 [Dokdonella sp.]